MEAAARPRIPARAQLGLSAALIALALVAWVITDRRMEGMDAGPGTELGGLGFFVGVWVVMMAAMMLPSISPMVAAYAGLQRGRREAGRGAPTGATAIFIAGYLLSWTVAGLLAYVVVEGLRAAGLGLLAWDRAGRYVAAGVLIAAAAYQLSPLKHACLRRCRTPLGFVVENWRDGRLGALRMGILHGGWCVGCCWALMAALLALGAMSVAWMILVAALIAAEKMLPWQWLARRGVAALLLALGIWMAAAPGSLPGLTVPESPDAMTTVRLP